MPKQTTGRDGEKKMEKKNAPRISNIILKQILDPRVHNEVRQARCRTNKKKKHPKKSSAK